MDGLLHRAGLDYERIAAVDGRKLSQDEVARHARGATEPLSAGEVGCFLSHRTAWRRIVEGARRHAAILEDDLFFSGTAARFLSSTDWIPADADIVKIETTLRRTTLGRARRTVGGGHFLALLRGHHFGSGGYIVSHRAARRLVDATPSATMPVDELLFNPRSPARQVHRIYQIVPALCIQAVMRKEAAATALARSDIARGRTMAPRRSHPARLKREIARLWNQFLTAVAGHGLNAWSDRINMRVPFASET